MPSDSVDGLAVANLLRLRQFGTPMLLDLGPSSGLACGFVDPPRAFGTLSLSSWDKAELDGSERARNLRRLRRFLSSRASQWSSCKGA